MMYTNEVSGIYQGCIETVAFWIHLCCEVCWQNVVQLAEESDGFLSSLADDTFIYFRVQTSNQIVRQNFLEPIGETVLSLLRFSYPITHLD